jgi:hypothetical protein
MNVMTKEKSMLKLAPNPDHFPTEGGGAGEGMLLVALGCGRLPGIFDIAARHPFVVFGTMEGKVLPGLTACVAGRGAPALPVYFYETG